MLAREVGGNITQLKRFLTTYNLSLEDFLLAVKSNQSQWFKTRGVDWETVNRWVEAVVNMADSPAGGLSWVYRNLPTLLPNTVNQLLANFRSTRAIQAVKIDQNTPRRIVVFE